MRINRAQTGTFCAALAILGLALVACDGSGASSGTAPQTPSPTSTTTPTNLPPSAFTTAACSTSGTTSANITPGNLAGVVTIATPAIGGCSYSNTFGAVANGATSGTYAGTISLTAPAGLPAIAGAPSGFSSSNFVPLFYVTLQLIGYQGTLTPDNPAISVTVNSIATSTNSSNFYIGSWSASVPGSTPLGVSATSFLGWSNNNNSAPTPANVSLTVTPPNTLSLPAYPCTPAAACTTVTLSSPQSYTFVQVVGYFT